MWVYSMVNQLKYACLSYQGITNCLKNAFGFKVLHWNRGGSKHLTFTKHLKEPFVLYLKAQENPSYSLLLEALKNASMIMWIPIFCCSKRVWLQWISECLWFIDSFLNAVSNNQIFLCFNCGAWHPRCYKAAQDKPTEFRLSARWTSHILVLFTLSHLIYLPSCPRYLHLSHMVKLNLKLIKAKCKPSLNTTDFGSGL